jgi:hypothetical protein
MNKILRCVVGALLASSALQVGALTVNFQCITPTSAANCAVGEGQFTVDVLAGSVANKADFTFRNSGSQKSAIEAIYFDAGSIVGITGLIDKDQGVGGSAGVDFTAGSASPPNLPGANLIVPNFVVTTGLLADADPPSAKMAIDPGEWLTIQFNIANGKSFNDLIRELQTGDLRIGMHAIAFANGGSISLVNSPVVPLPAAIWLLGSGLLALAGVRLRQAGC